ncbi:MAG: hypothetical protein HRU25_05910 [Psychrobium sp.]|nr:hypothetical protein [Psychrobium sp.]
MNIQDITVSNNQRKKIIACIRDDNVLQQDENGEVIIRVEAYIEFSNRIKKYPLEEIVGEDALDFTVEYLVFN